jgi:hypothetical protein
MLKSSRTITSATVAIFLLSALASAQQKERVLKKLERRDEPLKVLKLKIKGQQVNFNQSFITDDDWFRELTVKVENASKDTIVFIDLRLTFPPTGTAQRPSSDHLIYGHYPPPPGETGTPHPDQPPLQPGDTATLVLTDYEGTRDFLDKTGHAKSIKEIQLSIDEVIFANGLKWHAGGLMKRDPEDPNSWIPVPEPISSTPQSPQLNSMRFAKLSSHAPPSGAVKVSQQTWPPPIECFLHLETVGRILRGHKMRDQMGRQVNISESVHRGRAQIY